MMSKFSVCGFSILMLLLAGTLPAVAQEEPQSTADQDGASQQVEESDEAFRRRMELEDARYRDPTYTDPVGSYKQELEKIDKLPGESRDNIRDQLIDVIMTNGEWEPADALEEYPYTPTAAARADPKLAQQEQEAWEEQIEKYHERESEAFGTYRGPVQGPGNPQGPQGSQGGQNGEQGEPQGDEQGGQQGRQGGQQGNQGEQGEPSEKGTYQPYQSSNTDQDEAESRAGVSESALDFLMGRQGASSSSAQPQAPAASQNQAQAQAQNQDQSRQAELDAEQASEQMAQQEAASQPENSEMSGDPAQQDLRGILAIEDLDKLGIGSGTAPPPPEEEENDGEQLP